MVKLNDVAFLVGKKHAACKRKNGCKHVCRSVCNRRNRHDDEVYENRKALMHITYTTIETESIYVVTLQLI